MLRSFRKRLDLVMLFLGLWTNGVPQSTPRIKEPIFLNPHDERLVLEKDTKVAVLLPEEVSSKHPPESVTVIAASDVLVNEVIIIRRGEPVLFNLAVDKPKSMFRGAVLTLYVEGLRTLLGTDVTLARTSRTVGGSGCAMDGCELMPLFLWQKGQHATIPAGTLIPARVTQRVEIPAVEARSASAELLGERQTEGEAKVMVYMPDGEDSHEHGLTALTIKADGRSALRLSEGKWGCFALSGGDHTLQVGHDQFTFAVAAAQTYYLKLVSRGKNIAVMQTAGFQLEENALQFSPFTERAFSTECW